MARFSDDETVTVEVHCHAETPKAMLLSSDGVEGNAEWTPKSQIVDSSIGRGESGEVVMREWVAKKNGFI